MSSFTTEVVRFYTSIGQWPEDRAQWGDEKWNSIELIKELIERELSESFHVALSYGIRIGEAIQDPQWVQELVTRAKALSQEMSEEDQEELKPVLERYHG